MPLKNNISREQLKQQIGEENIFTHYFGAWDYGGSYSSVFREDNKNSTGFYVSKSGSIIYNDLRTGDKYDFVHFVMKKYALNYYEALHQIAVDFGLAKGVLSSSKVGVISAFTAPKKPLKKAFIVNTIPYQKQHLDFWAQYSIDSNDLKNNMIYAVDKFTINKFDEDGNLVKTYTCDDNEVKFVYTFTHKDETYVKIYNPYSKENKWYGDVPLTVAFGVNTLPHVSETLIVTKSVKDCLVLRKFFTDVIALQNESASAFDEGLLHDLLLHYTDIIIWFDNDNAGIEAATYFREKYGFATYTTPNKTEKDPSDFVAKYGLAVFKQYLQYIKLI